ncbi:MAG: U32 family peptidase [Kiritimatiellae bacterium]|nr:U32 family peptidase [Kiritimatiellia bacterium]
MSAEILAPAGDFQTALSAFAAGADAVYCGLPDFSARAFARNFSLAELADLVAYAHSPSRTPRRRVYVTFNTVIDEEKIPAALEDLSHLASISPDAIIVQDLGVASLCRRFFPQLELHASTQLVAHNLEGVLALKELGFRRVVLARELSLSEIRTIAERCGALKMAADSRPEMELECFIHGALCYSVSGLCLFGAMEKGRSGNRGACPYCCRLKFGSSHPFSMKDFRLGDAIKQLDAAGVSSLKIEGRMKSPLYVASVTRYYREILDGASSDGKKITQEDLETVFSRRTTQLYFNGKKDAQSVIDPDTVGHVGARVGVVKKVTKDRDGLSWMRIHTERALEKHDGLQFDVMTEEGRRAGFGISEMRVAISRRSVFEVPAHSDVEILVSEEISSLIKSGSVVYCSMSNAVKRMFPPASCRALECDGGIPLDVEVTLSPDRINVRTSAPYELEVSEDCSLGAANDPSKTAESVRKAFVKLIGTGYYLRGFSLNDGGGLYAPASILNALRRSLVAMLNEKREEARKSALAAALDFSVEPKSSFDDRKVLSTVKISSVSQLPLRDWDEIIIAISLATREEDISCVEKEAQGASLRLALPVYTSEPDFNRLRVLVKRFVRLGYRAWECSDLATLRMLKECGVEDITADWTLYAFNSYALALLSDAGVKRFVASPENTRENIECLAASGFDIEFLDRQCTPLFISLTKPETEGEERYSVFRKDGLYVTVSNSPRSFAPPQGSSVRSDYSWDPVLA